MDLKPYSKPVDKKWSHVRYHTGPDARLELANLRGSPLGEEIFNYLYERNNLPIIKSEYLGPGHGGYYKFGGRTPRGGIVGLDYSAKAGDRLHEMAHAADYELASQYNEARPWSFWGRPPPTQFTDAYEKLHTGGEKQGYQYQREALAHKLNPKWAAERNNYRSSNDELMAWGVGTTLPSYTDDNWEPPLHLNSTLATEMSILLDLARRGNRKPK
jgi:hypothetical protein